jgi:hypothetical protein
MQSSPLTTRHPFRKKTLFSYLFPLLSFSPVFLLPSFSTVSPISSFLYSLLNFSFSILFSLTPFLAQSVSIISCFLFYYSLLSLSYLLSPLSLFPVLSFPSFIFSPSLCLCYHLSQCFPYFTFSFVSFALSSPFPFISFSLSNLFLIISFLFSSFFPFAVCSLFILVFVFLLAFEDFHEQSRKKF